MAIKKRLTPEQRIKKALPRGFDSAAKHPLLQEFFYGDNPVLEYKPKTIAEAIRKTKSWRGASWAEKVFTLSLDLVMEKAFDIEVITPDTAERLHDHLMSNSDKMYGDDWRAWSLWVWGLYHDRYGLYDLKNGELALPRQPRRKLRKLAKHKN